MWLLDIDGVVNALAAHSPTEEWPVDAWVQRVVRAEVPGRGLMTLSVLVARPVLEFITAVHESGAAEIRWHSTWRAAAVTSLAPALGLPPIPISVAPEWADAGRSTRWWKLPAAQRVLASGRRLVWTDDDLDTYAEHGDPDTSATITALARRDDTLLISPDAPVGLQRAELDEIADFLSN